ncbi:MAG: OpgC domain-containing protein [Pseudomonadota bacterium]
MTDTKPISAPAKKARDLRLDFFRGMAMFIILLAHTPGNPWTLWIPARFGFSDATEIFVFCSGMASGLAFGAVFLKKSWFLGTARIAFRIWQVYWAHIGVFLVTALMLVMLNETGLGEEGKDYSRWFPIAGLFTRTEETLVGLFTLTYIPGLFDILPMYLVILAMVPVIMGIYRIGGREAVFAFMLIVWLCATLGNYHRKMVGAEDLASIQMAAVWLGGFFNWMNFPGIPWEEKAVWFFNPFGWQLVFFTGFCFTVGWIKPPPIRRWMVITAIAIVLITIPFAWHKMFQYYTGFIPESAFALWLWDAREFIEPVRWKTNVGAWRFIHFLCVAYLAYAAVGQGGIRLTTGWSVRDRLPRTRRLICLALAPVLILTLPYVLVDEIKYLAPGLDAWMLAHYPLLPGRWIGLAHLAFLIAVIPFLWHCIGERARTWLVRDAFLTCVPVIRKVGTQSLAVFLVSIVLSRFNGWWMDAMGQFMQSTDWIYLQPRDVWMLALVNGTGIGVLIATAYFAAWIKRQPWRDRKDTPTGASAHSAPGARTPVAAE